MSAKPPEAGGETTLERRLDRAFARATTPRGAAVLIACASIAITLGAGLVMTVLDHENFPTLGSGLWWAIQTTTTVGYGDSVPTTATGKIVAALVMLFGIGFLTIVTAAVTSTFVSRSRLEQSRVGSQAPAAGELQQVEARLERIEMELTQRLERIEAALDRRS